MIFESQVRDIIMTIRLNIQDQLSLTNNALPKDQKKILNSYLVAADIVIYLSFVIRYVNLLNIQYI